MFCRNRINPLFTNNLISISDAFKKTREHYKQLDMVVNNAGIGDESNWTAMIDINLVCIGDRIKGVSPRFFFFGFFFFFFRFWH